MNFIGIFVLNLNIKDMEFLEKDLEDVIYEAYQSGNQDFLIERGINVFKHDFLVRQLKLGDYGVADLVGIKFYPAIKHVDNFNDFCVVTIYELKKDHISMDTFSQIVKYAKAIKSYLKGENIEKFYIEYVLIGRSISVNSDNLCFLKDVFGNVSTYTYSYSFDGIRFKETPSYVKGNNDIGASIKTLKRGLFKLFLHIKRDKVLKFEMEMEEGNIQTEV